MDYKLVFISIVLVFFLPSECARGNQALKKIKMLESKFETLEEKVYQDEVETNLDIDYLKKQLNVCKGIEDDHTGNADPTHPQAADKPRLSDLANIVETIEERSNRIMLGFGEEKKNMREHLEVFKDDILQFRNKHGNELSNLTTSLTNFASEMNDTLVDRIAGLKKSSEQNMNAVSEQLNRDFNALNVTIHDDLVNSKESLCEWKNNTMNSFEKQIIDKFETMKKEIDKNFEPFMETIDDAFMDFRESVRDNQRAIDKVAKTIDKQTERIMRTSQHLHYYVCSQDGVIFEKSCYKLFTTKINWANAIYECNVLGGYLAEIDSVEEKDFLLKMGDHIWVGGSDYRNEGQWVWTYSNAKVDDRFWNPDEPNGKRIENCLEIYKGDGLNDSRCSDLKNYVCEVPFYYLKYSHHD